MRNNYQEPESNDGTKDTTSMSIGRWNPREQEPLETAGMSEKALYEMGSVKIANQNARSSAWLRSIKE
jgi:hypothetical protein